MNSSRVLRVSLLLVFALCLALFVALAVVSHSSAEQGTVTGAATAVTGAPVGTGQPDTADSAVGSGAATGSQSGGGTGSQTGNKTATGSGAQTTGAQTVHVAEHEVDSAKAQQGVIVNHGFAAFIDGTTDTLITRTAMGSSLNEVAVSPDGSRIYMTDTEEPVLHVFDAETTQWIRDITLPGVTVPDDNDMRDAILDSSKQIPYSTIAPCGTGVACTPDGALVLACSNAGLQVVDTSTNQVVRTLPDLPGGSVAVSFDGKRAYVSSSDYRDLAPRDWGEWIQLTAEREDCRLVCINLETWDIVKEIATNIVSSIAVKPDDSEVFFSEPYQHLVRVVDALTLDDLWSVNTDPSYALGLGFLPNGTKAYVVCSADMGAVAYYTGQNTTVRAPTAEEYFCGVIDTAKKEIIKRIPLEAY